MKSAIETRGRAGQRSQPPTLPALTPARKSVYALGDFTINTALSSLSLIYASYFLTQVADLRPALAGLVPLIGRALDAFTDPLMGRISDHTNWSAGRRRPYFLLGAIPFGVSFALLWLDPPVASQAARFAYYTGAYCLLSLSMTVLSVPYLAIQPEMTLDYDARTSLNTYRTAGSIFGVFAAVGIRPLANALGGGAEGFAAAGGLLGIVLTLPWIAVYRATFERPEFRARQPRTGFFDESKGSGLVSKLSTVAFGPILSALSMSFTRGSFRTLCGLYLTGRIAMDLIAALLILYVTYWLGRSGSFEITMLLFLTAVVCALPFWLRVSKSREKLGTFVIGSVWWMTCSVLLLFGQPDWPLWVLYLFAIVTGIGYAVVDVMPWAMLGEVIDEDDLRTGERREGIYNGVFTFIRKLGGAIGVFLVMSILDLAGFVRGDTQPESARQAIRILTGVAPAVFLLLSVLIALRYPLNRAAHAQIRARLAAREQAATPIE